MGGSDFGMLIIGMGFFFLKYLLHSLSHSTSQILHCKTLTVGFDLNFAEIIAALSMDRMAFTFLMSYYIISLKFKDRVNFVQKLNDIKPLLLNES